MENMTIQEFNSFYTSSQICLGEIMLNRYNNKCPNCKQIVKFYHLKGRTSYCCGRCKKHIYPLKDTIFDHSSTPLLSWFYVIYLFVQSKHGVGAKEVQRHIGVTYKTAWRMCHQIRLLFAENAPQLQGIVEMDESYYGGRKHGKRGRGSCKSAVFGMVERKGKVIARVVGDIRKRSIFPLIEKHVKRTATLMTDEYATYANLHKYGFNHNIITHKKHLYVDGNVYTNTMEGFWGLSKRGMKGTHIKVSKKYLQSYLDEYSYKYNNRDFTFSSLVSKASTLSL